jgi:hypothetical protein
VHELVKNAQTFCDRPVMVRVLSLCSRMWTITVRLLQCGIAVAVQEGCYGGNVLLSAYG